MEYEAKYENCTNEKNAPASPQYFNYFGVGLNRDVTAYLED